MNVKEYTQRLNLVRQELKATRPETSLVIAKDILALQKRRIINKGEDEKGQQIGKYSEAVVPASFYKNKEKRVGNAVEKLIKEHGWWASYKDWREVNNLGTAFKNFSFTGHMWASVYPAIVEQSEESVTVGLAASTDNATKKLQYVIANHPNILNLSESEKDLLQRAQTNRIMNILKKFGVIES